MILKNKSILITGVCGTVGIELVRQLLCSKENQPKFVLGIDNDESKLFFLDQKYSSNPKVSFFVSDIRDKSELLRRMYGVDVVFHLAALKHVILCERSPEQATETNIIGIQNIVESANQSEVELVVFTSSDKAVNPTNVMGATKLMGERLFTAANTINVNQGKKTRFYSCRFGNVLGSNGSVIPIFEKQIIRKEKITITDIAMTRFVMSIQDSVKLILESSKIAKGGEIFITKMPVIRILDLAHAMMNLLHKKCNYDSDTLQYTIIGTKMGEKLFEELMSSEEVRRTFELQKYFVVLPISGAENNYSNYEFVDSAKVGVDKPYISENETYLNVSEIESLLIDNGLLVN